MVKLPTHIRVTRPQWLETEKDNELASPERFPKQIGILNVQSTGEYYVLGLFCRKPWNLFTELISVFRNPYTANILIDCPLVTEFRI